MAISSTTFQPGHKPVGPSLKGRTMSEESRAKMRAARVGMKLSESHKRHIAQSVLGSCNGAWKGDKASYFAKHMYLTIHHGKPSKCDNPICIYPRRNKGWKITLAPKRFDWALIRGRKYTHNREDYMTLCPSCHKKYDMGLIDILIAPIPPSRKKPSKRK